MEIRRFISKGGLFMSNLLSKVEDYANEHHEGDFSVIKTKGKWHACFGIIEDKEDVLHIHYSETFEGVLQELIDDPIDSSGIRDSEYDFDYRSFQDVYAIKINDKRWLPDFSSPKERIGVFSTEKKAIKEVEYIKKRPKYVDFDFKVVKVEEEIFIHMKKGIHRQTIREL